MARRIELTRATGMGMTEDGFLELRGEVDGVPTTIVVPALAAPHLIACLATVADDLEQQQPERSDQDRAALFLEDASVQPLVSRDGAFLLLKLRGGIRLSLHAGLDPLERLGSTILAHVTRMRLAPPRTMN